MKNNAAMYMYMCRPKMTFILIVLYANQSAKLAQTILVNNYFIALDQ